MVIVAEMTHEGILGLETLTALGVALDFAGGTLSVNGGLVTAEEAWCTIEAAEPVIVPPHAEHPTLIVEVIVCVFAAQIVEGMLAVGFAVRFSECLRERGARGGSLTHAVSFGFARPGREEHPSV